MNIDETAGRPLASIVIALQLSIIHMFGDEVADRNRHSIYEVIIRMSRNAAH